MNSAQNLRLLIGVKKGLSPEKKTSLENSIITAIDARRNDLPFCKVYKTVDRMDDFMHAINNTPGPNCFIIMDKIGTEKISSSLIKEMLSNSPWAIIIPIIDSSNENVLLETLFNLQIYNALRMKEFTAKAIVELLISPRTHKEAYEYYGLRNRTLIEKELPKAEERDRTIEKSGAEKTKDELKRDFPYGQINARTKSAYNGSILESEESACAYLLQKKAMPLNEVREYDYYEDVQGAISEIENHYTNKGRAIYQEMQAGMITREAFSKHVSSYVKATHPDYDEKKRMRILAAYENYLYKYGVIAPTLDDVDVSDVRVLSPSTVMVMIKGQWHHTNIRFPDVAKYEAFVTRISTLNQESFNSQSAQPIFSDIFSHERFRLRFALSHQFITSSRLPSCHVRKIDKIKKTADKLVEEGLFSYRQAAYLVHQIRKGASLIIGGASGAGKTTLFNFLIQYLSREICGLGIQESEELFDDDHPNIEWLHTVYLKGEDKNNFDLRDLATAGLLKNTRIFLVGEIKGREARDFFTTWNTGSQCVASTHMLGIADALPRIADLAKYDGDYSQTDILRMMARAGGCVVFMDEYRVCDIANILGWDEVQERVIYEYVLFD